MRAGVPRLRISSLEAASGLRGRLPDNDRKGLGPTSANPYLADRSSGLARPSVNAYRSRSRCARSCQLDTPPSNPGTCGRKPRTRGSAGRRSASRILLLLPMNQHRRDWQAIRRVGRGQGWTARHHRKQAGGLEVEMGWASRSSKPDCPAPNHWSSQSSFEGNLAKRREPAARLLTCPSATRGANIDLQHCATAGTGVVAFVMTWSDPLSREAEWLRE